MIQVINGEIKQYKLPKTGTLKDGRTISTTKPTIGWWFKEI